MQQGLDQQSRAVHSGYWPLIRYNPALREVGEPPLTLDSVRPSMPFRAYAERELRYRMLLQSDPARGEALMRAAQAAVERKWKQYEELATLR
jgi:pyruvate-ferredoxin/flavodoxin oxidoreductase